MAVEAKFVGHGEYEEGTITLGAAAESGDVLQFEDGRACVVVGADDIASGEEATVGLSGVWDVDVADSIVILKGTPLWWDKSANAAVLKYGGAGDFFLGCAEEDLATGTGRKVKVRLNQRPCYTFGTGYDPVSPTIQEVLTAGAPRVKFIPGGWVDMTMDATDEAQAVSWMSGASIPVTDKAIVDIEFLPIDDGDAGSATTMDGVFGLADDDHASDPDSIEEFVGFTISGNTVSISAESDDGSTENAAADTSADYTLGAVSLLQIDFRDQDDIKLYVDGVRVISGTTFTLAAASGPMKLLGLVEKSSDTTTAQYRWRGGVRRVDVGGTN